MRLELTPDQVDYQQSVSQFAADVLAPRAAAIDETDQYPSDLVAEAAARGLLGVIVPTSWGGSGRDYVS